MQLKPEIRRALAAASGALLAGGQAQAGDPAAPAPAPAPSDWSFDSAVLYYSEAGRVSAFEPVASARWNLGDDEYLNFKFTWDSLSGASATGATPASTVQTFSGASAGGYAVQPGQTPLDPNFRDARMALNVGWDLPLTSVSRVTLAGNLSKESDYVAHSLSGNYSHDFNQKNTTLAAGVSYGHDLVEPIGGAPSPFSTLPLNPCIVTEEGPPCPLPGALPPRPQILLGTQTKSLLDVLLGVTQVLSPRSLVTLDYSWGRAHGYLSDPYKLVTAVDPAAGPTQGDPLTIYHEGRPRDRTKQAVYAQFRQRTDRGDTWDVSYRYMWDTWTIKSHTVDIHYRWMTGEQSYLQPHLRFYRQTAADFYRRFLLDGDPLPLYASADYRLGALRGVTVGLKWGTVLDGGSELGVHLEVYRQSGDSHPADAIGVLQGFDLFPTVTATMVQFDYTF